MNFYSDNTSAVNPEIIEAISNCSSSFSKPYGQDKYSEKLEKIMCEIFETKLKVFLVSTGTASNSIALKTLTPGYGTIFCTPESHIYNDESSAPEFFTGGAKLKPISSVNAKIQVAKIENDIRKSIDHYPHIGKPSTISLTQTTELGTVYSLDELQAICDFSKKNNLRIHMDGARFSGALSYINTTPANLTWKAGVDILSLGATKNGALMGEMIILFDMDLLEKLTFSHKQAGQLLSKTRYMSAQCLRWFEDDLWIKNATSANKMATQLSAIFNSLTSLKVIYPVQSNEVFVSLGKELAAYLKENGVGFHHWEDDLYRFVTSWQTSPSEIQSVEKLLNKFKN